MLHTKSPQFPAETPLVNATHADSTAALAAAAAPAALANVPPELPISESVRQLAISVARIEEQLAAILSRLSLAETRIAMVQFPYIQGVPIPIPYYSPPEKYRDWWPPRWQPTTVWCGRSEQ